MESSYLNDLFVSISKLKRALLIYIKPQFYGEVTFMAFSIFSFSIWPRYCDSGSIQNLWSKDGQPGPRTSNRDLHGYFYTQLAIVSTDDVGNVITSLS